MAPAETAGRQRESAGRQRESAVDGACEKQHIVVVVEQLVGI